MKAPFQCHEPSISEIREEIHSVLSSQTFRHSRGSAKLLRYICSSAFVESASPITEYTIAVDVFGKPADFKESKDAVVRVEVHRLRKRLGQFYEQEGASHPVQIVVPTGRYVPEFVFRSEPGLPVSTSPEAQSNPEFTGARQPECTAPPAEDVSSRPAEAVHTEALQAEAPQEVNPDKELGETRVSVADVKRPKWVIYAGVASIAALLFALFSLVDVSGRSEQTLDAFWKPVLSSPSPILLCIGNVAGGRNAFRGAIPGENPALTLGEFHGSESELVLFHDAAALARFAGLMGRKAKTYRIASQTEVTYADLQNGPAVLVGLLNNEWTRRLVGKLRFIVEHPAPGKIVIRDRNNPARSDWLTDYSLPLLSLTRDYALVVRVFDPKTEQMVVLAGGISAFGTSAASEFLTNSKEIRKLEAFAPKGWKGKNLEVVLSTEVIRARPGPPKVEAAYFW